MKIPKSYAVEITKKRIDMSLSTNPLGCSPRALAAIQTIDPAVLSDYPDTSRLISLLSQQYMIPANCIVLGNGSEQLIKVVSQACVRTKSRVVVERGSFFLFTAEPLLVNASVSYVRLGEKLPATKRPDLLFLANPTTPGGVDRTITELSHFIDTINARVTVVDEANGELGASSFIPLVQKYNSLIVLRTFSKTLGLAGLRIGYAITNPTLAQRIRRFQQPFPVSGIACIAASEALVDRDFIRRSSRFIKKESSFLITALRARRFDVSDSVTNNLYVSRRDNAAILRILNTLGVSVIDGTYFPGNSIPGFRISLRDKKTNRLFIRKLDEALSCLNDINLLPSKEDL